MTDAADVRPITLDGPVASKVEGMVADLVVEKERLEKEIRLETQKILVATDNRSAARKELNKVKRILSAVRGRPEPKAKTSERPPKAAK